MSNVRPSSKGTSSPGAARWSVIVAAVGLVTFGGILVVKVVGRFEESPDDGWEALGVVSIASAAVLACVVVVLALVVGPWIVGRRRLARTHARAAVYLARRAESTERELSSLVGREVLNGSRDDYFYVMFFNDRIEMWLGAKRPKRSASIKRELMVGLRLEPRALPLLGFSSALVIEFVDQGSQRELAFVLTRASRLAATTVSVAEYQSIADRYFPDANRSKAEPEAD